jgi:hypothetical protein
MSGLYILDRLDEEIGLQSRVKFRAWQGKDVFFTGTGVIQNIDPFGNIYIEPDTVMHIEGEEGAFDATVVMLSTSTAKSQRIEQQCYKALKEHKQWQNGTQVLVGVSWAERIVDL